jgi:hypothetical protein
MEEGIRTTWVTFIRALFTFPKVSPANTMATGVIISTYEFWGNVNIQSIAHKLFFKMCF